MNSPFDVLNNRARWGVAVGDCLASLRELPAESVQCVVTSPPYYGLRDYGTGVWVGGDPACEHKRGRATNRVTEKTKIYNAAANVAHWQKCGRCGATRQDEQIGLEDTPEQYIGRLLEVFREVRRVLRQDGTCWINIGDSYANDTKGKGGADKSTMEGAANLEVMPQKGWRASGLKKKDRIGIPHMLAFALRADGWYWRDEIVWAKPNPMTKSVVDRTTDAHEFLFLFSKQPKYFFDRVAISKRSVRAGQVTGGGKKISAAAAVNQRPRSQHMDKLGAEPVPETRNKRSVWRISSRRYKGAHFATFPPALVEPCILAGTSARGCCQVCGKPWVRETRRTRRPTRPGNDSKVNRASANGDSPYHGQNGSVVGNRDPQRHVTVTETIGWNRQCDCTASEPVGCVVMDPFAGSGTALAVAVEHHRRAFGLELNPEYADLIAERMAKVQPVLISAGE